MAVSPLPSTTADSHGEGSAVDDIIPASHLGAGRRSVRRVAPVAAPIHVFASAELDEHVTPPWHPERQGRLDAALGGHPGGRSDRRGVVPNRASTSIEAHRRVHTPGTSPRSNGSVRPAAETSMPTPRSVPGSWITARRAVGAVLDAVEALERGECDVAFAASRPPGHHALANQAMGFCLFNSVAVAAAEARRSGRTGGHRRLGRAPRQRHPGHLLRRPRVLYVSTHESPLYPGTGWPRETGGPSAPTSNLQSAVPGRHPRRRVPAGVRRRDRADRRSHAPTGCSSLPASTAIATIRSPASNSPRPTTPTSRCACRRSCRTAERSSCSRAATTSMPCRCRPARRWRRWSARPIARRRHRAATSDCRPSPPRSSAGICGGRADERAQGGARVSWELPAITTCCGRRCASSPRRRSPARRAVGS